MNKRLLSRTKLIFWDFDGVIKDSVDIKTQAYVKLFEPFGTKVAEQVRAHHEAHGGMSRFDKFPLYLQWAGEEPSQSKVNEFCDTFGRLVLQGVIEAPYVAGVETFLRSNPYQQLFVLVSATPQDELEQILHALNLAACFAEIFGAPTQKKDAIRMTLEGRRLDPGDCLMVGDARADLEAAEVNHVPFMLRLHGTNTNMLTSYTGISVKDFTSL